jgi:hypothetical protein
MENVVWISNRKPRLIHLPSETRKIKSDHGDSTIPLYNGKTIPPSVTSPTAIDRNYWDRVKSKKMVKEWLRLGWLAVSESAAGDVEAVSLAAYNEKTAVTLIDGEDNAELLGAWYKTETREAVMTALTARIAVVSGKVKK